MKTAIHNPAPLPLIHTRRYPTYQLYALAGNGELSPEETMVVCILETFQWLRDRFQAFGDQKELAWPEPAAFQGVSLSDFSSFVIDRGYKLEVIVLQEEKAWSLQLIEPDSGSRPGDPDQDRPPVPGRMFETNVGYRITDQGVECGFCTIVSEPSKTEDPCEVYRLAFIKRLARNPKIGLIHGYRLGDVPCKVGSLSDIKRLRNWLKSQERTMAAVILTEAISSIDAFRESHVNSILEKPAYPAISELIDSAPFQTKALVLDLIAKDCHPQCLLDAVALARFKLGYVQYFTVEYSVMDVFQKEFRMPVTPGDIFLWEPEAFGGAVERIKARTVTDKTSDAIEEFGQSYPKDKPMTFGNVLFMPKAKEIESGKMILLTKSREELMQAALRKEEGILAHHHEELRLLHQQINIEQKKNAKLADQIAGTEKWKEALRSQLMEQEAEYNRKLASKDEEILRLRALLLRPKTPKEVCGWVGIHYWDRLIFHPKAAGLMDSVGPGEVDLPVLCDAIEFLATEYRDRLRGLISDEEMNRRCAEKYNRPFTVTPLTGVSTDMYPKEYKIKYYIGYAGKPVESLLDLHLSVGNKADNLIRIYFLYDKDKQLVVVGSLPRHLPTASYK